MESPSSPPGGCCASLFRDADGVVCFTCHVPPSYLRTRPPIRPLPTTSHLVLGWRDSSAQVLFEYHLVESRVTDYLFGLQLSPPSSGRAFREPTIARVFSPLCDFFGLNRRYATAVFFFSFTGPSYTFLGMRRPRVIQFADHQLSITRELKFLWLTTTLLAARALNYLCNMF